MENDGKEGSNHQEEELMETEVVKRGGEEARIQPCFGESGEFGKFDIEEYKKTQSGFDKLVKIAKSWVDLGNLYKDMDREKIAAEIVDILSDFRALKKFMETDSGKKFDLRRGLAGAVYNVFKLHRYQIRDLEKIKSSFDEQVVPVIRALLETNSISIPARYFTILLARRAGLFSKGLLDDLEDICKSEDDKKGEAILKPAARMAISDIKKDLNKEGAMLKPAARVAISDIKKDLNGEGEILKPAAGLVRSDIRRILLKLFFLI